MTRHAPRPVVVAPADATSTASTDSRATGAPRPVSVPAYLDALAARSLGAGTVNNHAKVLRAAERDLGSALAAVTEDAWAQWLQHLRTQHAATSAGVRARIVRAYLRWAELPVPEALHATARTRQVPAAWREALAAWRAYQLAAGYPETTLTTRRHHLEQLATEGGHLDPWAVTRADLLAWLAGHPAWFPETRYGHRMTLRVFYRWAAEEGHITTDPAARLPTVRRPAPQARPLPVAHLHAAQADADERLGLMLALAAGYGLRRGEIAAVHARDVIDGTDGAPVLLVQGKGRKVRRLPITSALAHLIRDHGGYLFPGADDGHLSARWVGRLLSRALPEGWTAHTARHLFATTAYHLDRDLFTVQDLLGHASANTTRAYVQLDEHAKRGTVLGVADALHLTPAPRARTPRRVAHPGLSHTATVR